MRLNLSEPKCVQSAMSMTLIVITHTGSGSKDGWLSRWLSEWPGER